MQPYEHGELLAKCINRLDMQLFCWRHSSDYELQARIIVLAVDIHSRIPRPQVDRWVIAARKIPSLRKHFLNPTLGYMFYSGGFRTLDADPMPTIVYPQTQWADSQA